MCIHAITTTMRFVNSLSTPELAQMRLVLLDLGNFSRAWWCNGGPASSGSGFDFEPRAEVNVPIEFFGDDGVTFNTQSDTMKVIDNSPSVVGAFKVVVVKKEVGNP